MKQDLILIGENFFSILNWILDIRRIIIFSLLSGIAYLPCAVNGQEKDTSKLSKKVVVKNSRGNVEPSSIQGWAGPPNALDEGKIKEYYYVKIKARPSQKAVESDSQSMLKSTCEDAAKLNGIFDAYTVFMDIHVKEKNPEEGTGKVTISGEDGKSPFVCRYEKKVNSPAIVKECSGTIKGGGVATCWSNSSWQNCECLAYVKFPGGKSALMSRLSFDN